MFRQTIIVFILLVLSVTVAVAQGSCPALIEDALASAEINCTDLGRNQACYGYDQVEASFWMSVPDDYFAQPANLTDVAELETIRTVPMNTETGQWGIAIMNLQANLPNTLPGQNVTFILVGDVAVENAVAPEDVYEPSDGVDVTVTTRAGANLRSGPDTNYNVLGSVLNGHTLTVDGLSSDGTWLRTVYRDRPAWIRRDLVNDTLPALRDLPTLSAELYTPMQAFYLTTGVGAAECNEAPEDLLLVQGPENIAIQLTVNGAQIELGSTGILRTISEDNESFLEILVLDGTFAVDGQRIRAGQRSVICLDEDADSGQMIASCAASPPQTIPQETFGADWCNMEQIPSGLLNYNIQVLCPDELQTVNAATTSNSGTTASQAEGVSCDSFALVSPLAPVNSGNHTFSWTGVTGENIRYELVFYNQGQQVNLFSTTSTSYSLNLGADTATGGSFQWEVRAYSGGEYACVTARSAELLRTGELNPNPQVPVNPVTSPTAFRATLNCTTDAATAIRRATATYDGAISGGTVTMMGLTLGGVSMTVNGVGPSGTLTMADGLGFSNIRIIDSVSGQGIDLGSCP